MYSNFDFRGLWCLALIGMVALAVGCVGAIGGLVWFLVNHVRII